MPSIFGVDALFDDQAEGHRVVSNFYGAPRDPDRIIPIRPYEYEEPWDRELLSIPGKLKRAFAKLGMT